MRNERNRKRAGDPVLLKIDSVRRAVILWMLGWGYLWVVLIVAAMVFGGVLLDHAVVLQKWGRLAFFRAFVFSVGASVLVATLFPLVRRVGRLYVARRMEDERTDLRNSLISYLQCRDDPHTRAELKLLLRRSAAKHIGSLNASVAVNYARYVHLGVAVFIALMVLMVYLALSPKSAAVSLERLFMPRADILPPTATRLTEIEPGDVYLIQGDSPRLSVKVDGVRPQSVHVVWEGAGFEGRRLLLSEKERGTWQGRFPPILEDGSYYVAAGDTRSDRYRIKVLPRPVVMGVQLTLTAPAYSGLPSRTVSDGNVDVPCGTVIELQAATNLPPLRGYVQFDSGRRVWMQPVPGASAVRTEFTAVQSDAYAVHFETVQYPDGSSFRNPNPVRFTLTCREDRVPVVRIHSPPDGVELKPTDMVQIIYSASDDFSVAEVRLHYSGAGAASPRVTIAEPGVRRVEKATHPWGLSRLPLRAGSVITYYLEADDNWPDVPHTGRSEVRRIVIVGPEREAGRERASEARQGLVPSGPRPEGQAERGAEAAESEVGRTRPPREADRAELEESRQQPEESRGQPEGPEAAGEQRAAADAAARRRAEVSRRQIEGQRAQREQAEGPQGISGQAEGEPGAGVPPSQGAGGPAPFTPSAVEGRPVEGSEAEGGGAEGEGESRRLAEYARRISEVIGQEDGGQRSAESAQGGSREGGPQEGEAGERQPRVAEGEAGAGQQGPLVPSPGLGTSPSPGRADQEPTEGPGAEDGETDRQSGEESAAPAGPRPGGAATGSAPGGSSSASGPGVGGESTGPSGAAGEQARGDAVTPGSGPTGQAGGGQPGGAGRGAQGEGVQTAEGVAVGHREEAGDAAPSGTAVAGSNGGGVRRLPPAGPPEGPLDWAELDKAVEQVQRMLEEDRLPPRFLEDLGTNRQKLKEFIERYREQRLPADAARPEESLKPEAGRVLEGAEKAAAGVAVKDALPLKSLKDTLRSRFEGAADRLSPRYRDTVDQYYKALSEEP